MCAMCDNKMCVGDLGFGLVLEEVGCQDRWLNGGILLGRRLYGEGCGRCYDLSNVMSTVMHFYSGRQ